MYQILPSWEYFNIKKNSRIKKFLHFIKNLFRVFENLFLVVHFCIIPNKNFLFYTKEFMVEY